MAFVDKLLVCRRKIEQIHDVEGPTSFFTEDVTINTQERTEEKGHVVFL
jgi:hypothetical protein